MRSNQFTGVHTNTLLKSESYIQDEFPKSYVPAHILDRNAKKAIVDEKIRQIRLRRKRQARSLRRRLEGLPKPKLGNGKGRRQDNYFENDTEERETTPPFKFYGYVIGCDSKVTRPGPGASARNCSSEPVIDVGYFIKYLRDYGKDFSSKGSWNKKSNGFRG